MARAAGLVTLTGWAVVFGAVLVLRLIVPPAWTVVALAAAVSVGMLAGGAVGAVVVRRSEGTSMPWLPRSLLLGLLAAAVAGGLVGWLWHFLSDVGLVAATAGAAGRRWPAPPSSPPSCSLPTSRCWPRSGAWPAAVRRRGRSRKIGQVLTSSTGGIGRHAASVVHRLVGSAIRYGSSCPPETAQDPWPGHAAARMYFRWPRLGRPGRRADVIHAHGYKAGCAGGSGRPAAADTARGELAQRRPRLRPAGVGRSGLLQRLVARAADA